MEDEVEISGKDEYEVFPVSPMRRIEDRVKHLEYASAYAGVPQLQGLITQIVELVKSNQKIIDDVIRANSELRNELSRLPPKMEDLIVEMKSFMNLIKMAGEEEVSMPPEAMKPVTEQFQKMVEQNQKLVESNQEVLSSLEEISKKLKTGTPVSQLLSSYPRIRIKSFDKQQ